MEKQKRGRKPIPPEDKKFNLQIYIPRKAIEAFMEKQKINLSELKALIAKQIENETKETNQHSD